ncbi:DUF397 domain-containing protein [Streptomyces sp. NPDC001165]|uniref:DUF397 domain-containing protein n=1 Tax=Streptomyces sp. NPDC001165 TaxID=3364546 RepID=UPI0036C00211
MLKFAPDRRGRSAARSTATTLRRWWGCGRWDRRRPRAWMRRPLASMRAARWRQISRVLPLSAARRWRSGPTGAWLRRYRRSRLHDFSAARWRNAKASCPAHNCVEITELPGGCIAVCDSKNTHFTPPRYTATEWLTFREAMVGGEL